MGRVGSDGTPGIGGKGIGSPSGGMGGKAPLKPGIDGSAGNVGSDGTPGIGGSAMANPKVGSGGTAKPGGVGSAGSAGRAGTPGMGGSFGMKPRVIAGRLQLTADQEAVTLMAATVGAIVGGGLEMAPGARPFTAAATCARKAAIAIE